MTTNPETQNDSDLVKTSQNLEEDLFKPNLVIHAAERLLTVFLRVASKQYLS